MVSYKAESPLVQEGKRTYAAVSISCRVVFVVQADTAARFSNCGVETLSVTVTVMVEEASRGSMCSPGLSRTIGMKVNSPAPTDWKSYDEATNNDRVSEYPA